MKILYKTMSATVLAGMLSGTNLTVQAAMQEQDILPKIEAGQIGLPTGGAEIVSKELLTTKSGSQYYAVRGQIKPVDQTAPAIEFQVNLPLNWNGKLAQFGGGGFDGFLVTADGESTGMGQESLTPLEQGYVTFGSDSGHKSAMWEAEWALNDEALENFAYKQLKKTKDVAAALSQNFYGKKADKVYFIGGSNGGREALMTAQRFPLDYDGVVAFYPVLNWVPKAIKDSENGDNQHRNNGKDWLSPEQYQQVIKRIYAYGDELDGSKDGLISDMAALDTQKDKVFSSLRDILSPGQIDSLAYFYRDKQYAIPMADDYQVMPGYSLSQLLYDAPFNQLGTGAVNRDGNMEMFGDQVIKYQIMRDKKFDPKNYQTKKYAKQIFQAAKLLDATSTELTAFKNHGGKLILLHGTADQLVAANGSVRYFKDVQKRYGKAETANFMRFYLVPGYGHGEGSIFTMGRDLLLDLDNWVSKGEAPEKLTVIGQNPANKGKTIELVPAE